MDKVTLYDKIVDLDIEKLFKTKGYAYFTKGTYNLNIIGVRSSDITTNIFNDFIIIDYKDFNNNFNRFIAPATTDPGKYYLNKPMTKDGTAILASGQYPNVWSTGLHQGKYTALCQRSEFIVYRDNNKDNKLDFNESAKQHGMFGINLHKAGKDSLSVDNWSAGCQVVKRQRDFESIMSLVEESKKHYPDKFTYTLITERDIDKFNNK